MTVRPNKVFASSQLVQLERIWLAHGMTEAEIHSVSPDRGQASPSEPVDTPVAAM